MSKNYLLIYSEQLATDIELLCQNIKAPSNTLFQIRKSSGSVFANISEANYGQSRSDMVSKFEIVLKECIVYTVGAILYVIGKKKHYIHSVFHIFVVVASILQFFGIFFYVI